jgi:hypothetical protein
MPGYWENEMCNRTVFKYSFAPFLEEASILLYAAARLWHPWSLRRIDELIGAAYTLKDRAEHARRCGLGWACNIEAFGSDPAGLLGSSAHYRYHEHEKLPPCPKGTAILGGAALQLFVLLMPTFEKMEELSYEEKGWLKWVYGIVETLTESPCLAGHPDLSVNTLRTFALHAVLLECEGLAHTQARIEDSLQRNCHGNDRKRKKSKLSEQELRNLASELNMPFETVKEVFETEYSNWWDESKKYRIYAERERDRFLAAIATDGATTDAMRAAWDSGMVTEHADPDCWSEESCLKSERVVSALIAMFLSFADDSPQAIKAFMLSPPEL